ncbi:DELLA protein RGA [Linum grandiflorum]
MFHPGNPPPKTFEQDDDQTFEKLFSPTSVELLKTLVKDTLIRKATSEPSTLPEQRMTSLPDIIRMAAAKFINPSSSKSNLNDEEAITKQVELVQHLLTAAEEVGRQDFEQAISLLEVCDSLSSKTGDLTQRVVYYFAHALRERVYNESGVKISSLVEEIKKLNIEKEITAPSPIVAAIYAKIPFYQVGQLAGVQAIVESVERAKRIHVIDLSIRNGMQWTALMQALASRRKPDLEILRITAIVSSASEDLILETGERLVKFAKSINVPLAFRTVVVPDMVQIDKKQFNLDARDAVAIFSEYALQDIIGKPNQLEALMIVIRHIRPMVMVVIETEANFNSLDFSHRFVEVLFHFGAYFDCIDTCFDNNDENKTILESMFLSDQVNGALVKGGMEMTRSVTIDVWRKFFSQFWMVEAGFSPTAMETVNLLLGGFSSGECCKVNMDGRSLVVEWKGTPMFSLSTWKFLIAKPLKPTYKKRSMETCGI